MKKRMDYSALYHHVASLHARLPYRWGSGFAFPPLHVYFELTYRCNLRCAMCPYRGLGSAHGSLDGELSTTEIKGVVDQLNAWALITFTGGEPLVREDIGEIVAHSARRHRCHLITNGVLLDASLSRLLAACGPKRFFQPGLLAVMVSLEGPEDIHDSMVEHQGAHRKTLEGIALFRKAREKMKKRYPLVGSTTVITRRNVEYLASMVDNAETLGLDICNFTMLNPFRLEKSRTEAPDSAAKRLEASETIPGELLLEQYQAIMKRARRARVRVRFAQHGLPVEEIIRHYENQLEMERYVCRSPWSRMIVSAYGDVIPCFGPALGNVRNERLRNIWNGPAFRSFRRRLRSRKVFSDCAGCCMLEYQSQGRDDAR